MKTVVIGNQKIRPVTYGLALYFLLIATDCVNMGVVGSLIKIVAFIPLALSFLDIERMQIRFNMLLVIQILFCLLAVSSVFYSVQQSTTVTSVVSLILNFVLVHLLGTFHSFSDAEVKFLNKAMLCGCWLTVLLMLFSSNIAPDGRLTMQLGQAIQDQNYINGYIIFAFSYHCNAVFSNGKWRHMIGLLFVMGVTLLTGSRGSLLAYVAVLMVHLFCFVARTEKPLRNLGILIMIVVVLLVFFEIMLKQMPAELAKRFSWDYIQETGTIGRSRIWRYFWDHFCNDSIPRMLFGHGHGTSTIINQLNGQETHNLYLDTLITLGTFGLMLQLLTQGYVLYDLFRRKETVLLGAYTGFLVMCLSLSIVAYKPLWNVVLLGLITRYSTCDKE